jgi:hypothetical protein
VLFRSKELLFPPSALLKQSRLFGKFKDEYVKGWMDILKKAYPDNWKEKDSIFVGHEAGLYSKENTRSLLMNLTSSYSAFCVIHKDINTYLVNSGNQPISYGDNPEQNLIELRRFFSVLNGIRSKFFSSTSGTLKQVGGILKKTDCLGKRNEQAAQQIINQNLGENSCEIKSGAGHSIDMKSGIDANIKINSTENTAQIKPFTSTIDNESTISVLGSSSTKSYNRVDLMVFVNVKNKVVKIYKTNGITIEKNNYIIPKENEVMTLFAKTELELIDCNQFLSNSSSW